MYMSTYSAPYHTVSPVNWLQLHNLKPAWTHAPNSKCYTWNVTKHKYRQYKMSVMSWNNILLDILNKDVYSVVYNFSSLYGPLPKLGQSLY